MYDVDSTGLLIFEALDIFTFRHNNIDYKTIMLNDDIKLTQGLVETTFAEKPEETKNDYITTDKDKNKLNNALISLDKANAEIVLKTDSNGRISQVRLDSNADSGSVIEINADQVNLTANDILNLIAGNTINLTSKNIEIDSTNFKVDKDGKVLAKNGEFSGKITAHGGSIGGWEINENGLTNGTVTINKNGIINTYTPADLSVIMNHILGNITLRSNTLKHYDFNGDGQVTSADYVHLYNMIEDSFK